MYALILTLFVVTFGDTLIAFGDWGDAVYRPQILKLNQFIRSNIRNESRSDAVLLLGDNFYPDGIRPSLQFFDPRFLLFSRDIARNVANQFLAVLGNHDYLTRGSAELQMNYSKIDSRWYLPAPLYSRMFPIDRGLSTCIYGIDSIQFNAFYAQKLNEWISKDRRKCLWIILISHFPVYTFGTYYADKSVERFRAFIEPVLDTYKSKISLVLSGHEHSSQIISKGPNSPLFVVVGASIDVRRDSIMQNVTGYPGDVKLVYHNDQHAGIVARIVHTQTLLKLELVDIETGTVLTRTSRYRKLPRLIR